MKTRYETTSHASRWERRAGWAAVAVAVAALGLQTMVDVYRTVHAPPPVSALPRTEQPYVPGRLFRDYTPARVPDCVDADYLR